MKNEAVFKALLANDEAGFRQALKNTEGKLDLSRENLKSFSITRPSINVEILAKELETNTTITALNLSHINFSKAGFKRLLNALKRNSSITALDLSINYHVDAEDIAELLRANPSITSINLNAVCLGDKGMKKIADAVKSQNSVKEIHLENNSISEEGGMAIANMLEEGSSIQKITLSTNPIGDKAGREIAEKLTFNTVLEEIALNGMAFSSATICAISKALEVNLHSSVTKISLGYGNAYKEGAKAIAAMLKANKVLKEIDLESNQLDDEGIKEIASSLHDNPSVTCINLSYNSFAEKGTKELAKVLKASKSITQIKMLTIDLGVEGAKELLTAVEANPNLRIMRLTDHGNNKETVSHILLLLKERNATIDNLLRKVELYGSEREESHLANYHTQKALQAELEQKKGEQIKDSLYQKALARNYFTILSLQNAMLLPQDYLLLKRCNTAMHEVLDEQRDTVAKETYQRVKYFLEKIHSLGEAFPAKWEASKTLNKSLASFLNHPHQTLALMYNEAKTCYSFVQDILDQSEKNELVLQYGHQEAIYALIETTNKEATSKPLTSKEEEEAILKSFNQLQEDWLDFQGLKERKIRDAEVLQSKRYAVKALNRCFTEALPAAQRNAANGRSMIPGLVKEIITRAFPTYQCRIEADNSNAKDKGMAC